MLSQTAEYPRLVVRVQPPTVWYNQMRGKNDYFEATVELKGMEGYMCSMASYEIRSTLLYESHRIVDNQGILQVMTRCHIPLGKGTARVCTIRARINEVSKNHQSQRFCLKFDADSNGLMDDGRSLPPIAPVVTEPVSVLSKPSRKSREGGNGGGVSASKRRRTSAAAAPLTGQADSGSDDDSTGGDVTVAAGNSTILMPVRSMSSGNLAGLPVYDGPTSGSSAPPPPPKLIEWAATAFELLQDSQWQTIGYATMADATGGEVINMNAPIRRCPDCRAISTVDCAGQHSMTCRFQQLLTSYSGIVSQGVVPVPSFRMVLPAPMKQPPMLAQLPPAPAPAGIVQGPIAPSISQFPLSMNFTSVPGWPLSADVAPVEGRPIKPEELEVRSVAQMFVPDCGFPALDSHDAIVGFYMSVAGQPSFVNLAVAPIDEHHLAEVKRQLATVAVSRLGEAETPTIAVLPTGAMEAYYRSGCMVAT